MDVKVCNYSSSEFAKDFLASLLDTGFAVVTNHGVSEDLIRETQRVWKMFFLDDQDYKQAFVSPDGNMGYKGWKTEKAVGAKVPDLKEFYHWRPGGRPLPASLSGTTSDIFGQLEDVGIKLLEILGYADCCKNSNNTILRTIYYPPVATDAEPGAVRSAAHEDINFITLLVAASAPGLQVKDTKGNWHDVPHEENSIVVNVGDMLQLASGGRFKSTTHRVVNPDDSTSDRISMPLFVHPNPDTVLDGKGFTAGEFLAQRIAEITAATK
jgi:isopenicillin N synthase-like dioxygenase